MKHVVVLVNSDRVANTTTRIAIDLGRRSRIGYWGTSGHAWRTLVGTAIAIDGPAWRKPVWHTFPGPAVSTRSHEANVLPWRLRGPVRRLGAGCASVRIRDLSQGN